MKQLPADAFEHLVEHYLGLEMTGSDRRTPRPLWSQHRCACITTCFRRRLHEEEAALPQFEARGYVRLREKGEQLDTSLRALIAALEQEKGV